LPLAVRGGLAGKNDWTLTFLAAFSFLLHFGLVGSMYSDWSDPIASEKYDLAALVDMMGKVPPPALEVPEERATGAPPTKVPLLPTREPVATQVSGPRRLAPSAPESPESHRGPASDERAAQLAEQAATMNMQLVAGLGGGPSVRLAIERSNIPPVDL